jgi:hypothetical protein
MDYRIAIKKGERLTKIRMSGSPDCSEGGVDVVGRVTGENNLTAHVVVIPVCCDRSKSLTLLQKQFGILSNTHCQIKYLRFGGATRFPRKFAAT